MIYLILFYELALSLLPNYLNSWEFYGAAHELRAFLLLLALFVYMPKRHIALNCFVLLTLIHQVWDLYIFASFYLTGKDFVIPMLVDYATLFLVIIWLLARSYSKPNGSIDVRDIESGNVYVIVRKPSLNSFFDTIKSMFGIPAGSVAVYCDGNLYGYLSKNKIYSKQTFKFRFSSQSYAIKLNIDSEIAKHLLEYNIGKKFNFIFRNCSNTPMLLWCRCGVRNIFFCSIPGLLVSKLSSRGLYNGRRLQQVS